MGYVSQSGTVLKILNLSYRFSPFCHVWPPYPGSRFPIIAMMVCSDHFQSNVFTYQ